MSKLSPGEQAAQVARSAVGAFRSDGCTASPDFTFRHCCEKHDYHYRTGVVSRAEADRLMRICLQQDGYVVLPWVYWVAVRLFGRGFYYGGEE